MCPLVSSIIKNQDEEIWIEWIDMLLYKDQKHIDKFVKMSSDNESQDSYKIFIKIITLGS